jgi:hypothetical protein
VITTLAGGIFAAVFLLASRMTAWKRPISYGQYISLGTIVVMIFAGTAFERL